MKKNKLIKPACMGLAVLMSLGITGCSMGVDTASEESEITVISREEGSGTRDAFSSIMEIMEDGVDMTLDAAEISNSTAVVIQSVAGDENAIGYASLGNVDDSVKVVTIDGIEANEDNITSGDYKLTRSFKMAVSKDTDELAEDFMNFVLSAEGQEIITDEGYVSVYGVNEDSSSESSKDSSYEANKSNEPAAYEKSEMTGELRIAGSTSVAPLIEVLADKYEEYYDDVDIEVQQTGTSAGIQSLTEGTCDIAIISRDLTDDEAKEDIEATDIAIDGIIVIVNKSSDIEDIASSDIKKIFTGKITTWNQLEE